MFNRLYLSPGKVGANAACNYWSNLWSVHQVPHYGWVDRGSVEYEVYPTLLHMASTGNWHTPDLLILSTTTYPLGNMLPQSFLIHQNLATCTTRSSAWLYGFVTCKNMWFAHEHAHKYHIYVISKLWSLYRSFPFHTYSQFRIFMYFQVC